MPTKKYIVAPFSARGTLMPTAGGIYYFTSNGVKNQNPPIVLLHGAGGTHLNWPHNIRRMPSYKVFAPDLPGHGKSEGVGQQSIHGYAREVVTWLQEVGIYQAVFIGHSMGGAIAQTLALEYSEHVLGLGLVGTGAKLYIDPEILKLLEVQGTFRAAVERIIEFSFSQHPSNGTKERILRQLINNRPSVMQCDYLACQQFDATEQIHMIQQPTTVICGQDDKMTPPRLSEFLVEKIPQANYTLVPDAGHMVMVERPEAVGQALEDFLAAINF